MRWLFLDTHIRGEAVFGWLTDDGAKVWKAEGRGNAFLSAVAAKCKPDQIADARGVCVVTGPGPFSAIRLGVLVANVMSRTFGVPLYPVAAEQASDLEALARELAGGKIETVAYAAPVYDSEPNITLPQT